MFLDASAIVAILNEEPEAEVFQNALPSVVLQFVRRLTLSVAVA